MIPMKTLRLLPVFLAWLLLGSGFAWAQLKQKGEGEAAKHPTVTFEVNDRDPNVHPEGYFKVLEDEKEVKFEVKNAAPNDSGFAKSILIIWEYLPSKASNPKPTKSILPILLGPTKTTDPKR